MNTDIKNMKVIIFDLDSTLTESKQAMAPDMAETFADLLDKVPVGVMSGADLPQFQKQLLPYLPKRANLSNLYLFPTSAAECLIYKDGAWVQAYDYAFTADEKKKIIDAINSGVDKTGVGKGEELFGEQIEDRGEQITFSALGQEAPLDKKSVWDPHQDKRRVLAESIAKLIPEFEVHIGGTTSIDITRKDITKEDGVIWLEKHFGIPAEEMLYVGDALYIGGNDTAVYKTNINTQQVNGPADSKKIIEEFLAQ